jgi:hypothetical protein
MAQNLPNDHPFFFLLTSEDIISFQRIHLLNFFLVVFRICLNFAHFQFVLSSSLFYYFVFRYQKQKQKGKIVEKKNNRKHIKELERSKYLSEKSVCSTDRHPSTFCQVIYHYWKNKWWNVCYVSNICLIYRYLPQYTDWLCTTSTQMQWQKWSLYSGRAFLRFSLF